MWKNSEEEYGYYMVFSEYIDADEMQAWGDDAREMLETSPDSFGVFVDMRDLDALSEDAQQIMTGVKSDYHDHGKDRCAFLFESPTTRLQFEQMSETTGGADGDRYLDAQSMDDAERKAREWAANAVEPE
jgi:hypothetical protein